MYQLEVFYGSTIEEVVYNYSSIEEALKDRYIYIEKYYDIYEGKGLDLLDIYDNLSVLVLPQDGV